MTEITTLTLDGIDTEKIAQRGQDARDAFYKAEKEVHVTSALEMAVDTLGALPNARFIELGDSDQGGDRVWVERILDADREEVIESEDGEVSGQDVVDSLSDIVSYLPTSKPTFIVKEDGTLKPGTDPDYAWYIENRQGDRFIDIAVIIAQHRAK